MPKALERTLTGLLVESELMSWKIQGGQFYTQVSIRFKADDMDTSNKETKVYKQVPKSRLLRDKQRARQYRQPVGTYNDDADVSDVESDNNLGITEGVSQTKTTATTQGINIIETVPQNTPAVEQEGLSAACEASEDIGQSADNSESSDHCVKDKPRGTAVKRCRGATLKKRSYSSAEDSDPIAICGLCSADINSNKWHRCTDCHDVDICDRCYQWECHDEHQQAIHTFVFYPDSHDSSGIYCQSCGYPFRKGPKTFVFQCKSCEDYCICSGCLNSQMHSVHKEYMQQRNLNDYIRDVH